VIRVFRTDSGTASRDRIPRNGDSRKAHPDPAPTQNQLLFAAVVVVLFLGYIGYRIYSGILNQMAKNAKNKRIIKNEVTQWTGREYRRSKRR
jgi:hypothetical protein